jgi:hypothetical protein
MKVKLALSQENLVHGVALLTAAMGVVNVISAVILDEDRLRILRLLGEYSPFSVRAEDILFQLWQASLCFCFRSVSGGGSGLGGY